MKTQAITCLLALATVLGASAQKPQPRGERRPPPPPPLIAVIDSDHDGILSAKEIESASEAIAKLDQNGDGELTPEEMRMPSPPDPPKPPKDGQNHNERPRPPLPPVIAALDADQDGTLSAAELDAAPEALKTLDKNGDGELSPEELRPHGPPPHEGGRKGGRRPPGPPLGEEEGAAE
ncbi:MAG: hypothetical protein EOP85_02155 [Verrucomicrobiaceae bacterium]|nr:MAG: hypothetical protein EOP85_02155 [Verrucomicrobiaceae bacterium]